MKITPFIITLLLINTQLLADTAEITPVKDNTLYETTSGNTSNGAGSRVFIGKTGVMAQFRKRRAVMQFDLNVIPNNSVINSVTLEVVVSNAPSDAFSFDANLHLLLADWGEGTSNGSGNGASSTANDATWVHRFFDTTNWNTAGGDFFSTTSATAGFGASNNETITFSTTSDLVADVQMWVDNPALNYGWILLGDELSNQNARGLSSREGNNPPTLTIDFTPPPNLIFANGFES